MPIHEDTRQTASIGKVARIPADIVDACESKARARRKRTGDAVRWTDIMFAAVRKQLGPKN